MNRTMIMLFACSLAAIAADSSSPQKIPALSDPSMADMQIFEATYRDSRLGVSLALPPGWKVKLAQRLEGGPVRMHFSISGFPEVVFGMNYRANVAPDFPADSPMAFLNAMGPRPTEPKAIAEWLQNALEVTASAKSKVNSYPRYDRSDPNIVIRSVSGHLAISWRAEFQRSDGKATEYATIVAGDKVIATVFFNAPNATIDAVQKEFEVMLQNLHIP